MATKTYYFIASIQENANCYNTGYAALDIEYKTEEVPIVANNEPEAIKAFQESTLFFEFANKHVNTTVNTFIKAEGDTSYHRV